jgi:hypothetical protein
MIPGGGNGSTGSYSDWMKQNQGLVDQNMSRMSTPPAQAPAAQAQLGAQTQAVSSAQQAPTPMAEPAQEASGPSTYQKTSNLVGAVVGGQQPRQPDQFTLRESAYSTGPKTQSDAPNAQAATPMGGRANKIMEIVGAIFSMGATKAASQAQKQNTGTE